MLTKEGYRIKIEAVIDGEQKVLYAGYKAWKCNDLYPSDFTKDITAWLMQWMQKHCICP